jgi:hypothetical protein
VLFDIISLKQAELLLCSQEFSMLKHTQEIKLYAKIVIRQGEHIAYQPCTAA